MKTFTRRTFLRSTALSTATLGLSARSWGQVAGSNSDVRVAVVGFNGRGCDHISALGKADGARITALCDADQDVLDRGVKKLAGVEGYTDIRKLLESKNVDAVSIAPPNHWPAVGLLWAVQ